MKNIAIILKNFYDKFETKGTSVKKVYMYVVPFEICKAK